MSKPKEYRVCAYCGTKQHKLYMLKVILPDIIFDFWQNMQSRGFYVCQKHACIKKVFKKKTVYKYLGESLNTNLLYDKLKECIKNNTVYHIHRLFDKYAAFDTNIDTSNLVLCRYDILTCSSNGILLDKAVYSGSKKKCIIYDKYIADKLIKYKNLITNIDDLFMEN